MPSADSTGVLTSWIMPGADGEQVMVDQQLSELAQRSPNFGFLLPHEAVLVGYGAGAEALVFSDPNTSMIKARRFGEQLVAALVTSFGIRLPAKRASQHTRLKVLLDQGVITARVHSWFDIVRDTGNKAVHEGYGAQRDALRLVRTCYELGAQPGGAALGQARTGGHGVLPLPARERTPPPPDRRTEATEAVDHDRVRPAEQLRHRHHQAS